MNCKGKIFYIEITKACNLKCSFCPSSNLNNKKMMNSEDFFNVISKIKEESSLIYFHVLGEPTLHPLFKEYVKHCYNQKLQVGITTNGTNLKIFDDELLLLDNINKINISLQSLIGKSDDDINLYLVELYRFLQRKNKNNVKLPINLRLWNDKTKNDVILLNDKVISVIDEWLMKDQFKNVRFSFDDEFEWPNTNSEYNKSGNCLGGKRQLAILNDGSVCLCCLDYLGKTKIGNILTEKIEDIYQKEEYKMAIDGFCNGKPYFDLCKKCTYRNRFIKK